MNPADTISCNITPQSLHPLTVLCETESAESSVEWWTVAAAWVGASLTLATVIVAVLAWRSAIKNLLLVRRQVAEQRIATRKSIAAQMQVSREAITAQQDAAIDAIKAQQQLAVDSRQVEFLAEYSNALLHLGETATSPSDDIDEATRATTRTWMTWSIHMFTIDPEFRQLTSRWNMFLNDNAKRLHGYIAADPDLQGNSTFIIAANDYKTQMGHIIGNLHVWQTDPLRRAEVHKKFLDLDNQEPVPVDDYQ